ncbi:hypothetical protein [Rhizobium herbae]|jgi:hypothetical protein
MKIVEAGGFETACDLPDNAEKPAPITQDGLSIAGVTRLLRQANGHRRGFFADILKTYRLLFKHVFGDLR